MRLFSSRLQKLTKGLSLALLVVILAGVGSLCNATVSTVPFPFTVSLEPSMPMEKNAPITMNLTITTNSRYKGQLGDTGSVSVYIVRLADPGIKLNETSWPIKYDKEFSYSTTFEITIPDDDISRLYVYSTCGKRYQTTRGYFRTTEETVMYDRGGVPKLPPRPEINPRDTLTIEQLNTKYAIGFSLRNPQQIKYGQEILGKVPDSCKVPGRSGFYKMEVSYDNILKLIEYGIHLDFDRTKPEKQSIEDSLEGGKLH